MSDFFKISLSLPMSQYEELQRLSKERRLPMSRLVWYAIDNEMECAEPFNYLCEKPESTFVKHAYTAEAQKMSQFLFRYGEGGIDLPTMMILRRQMGIPSKTIFMLALRELLETKLAVESRVSPKGRFYRELSKDLVWVRLAGDMLEVMRREEKHLEKQKAKVAEKEADLQKKRELMGWTDEE